VPALGAEERLLLGVLSALVGGVDRTKQLLVSPPLQELLHGGGEEGLRDTFIRRATPWASRNRSPSREIAVFTVDELIPVLLPEF
jgi:hypothetical protein